MHEEQVGSKAVAPFLAYGRGLCPRGRLLWCVFTPGFNLSFAAVEVHAPSGALALSGSQYPRQEHSFPQAYLLILKISVVCILS